MASKHRSGKSARLDSAIRDSGFSRTLGLASAVQHRTKSNARARGSYLEYGLLGLEQRGTVAFPGIHDERITTARSDACLAGRSTTASEFEFMLARIPTKEYRLAVCDRARIGHRLCTASMLYKMHASAHVVHQTAGVAHLRPACPPKHVQPTPRSFSVENRCCWRYPALLA